MFNILSYPPTEDQLKIIDGLYEYLSSEHLLWSLRFFSFIFIIFSLFFWYKILEKFSNKYISKIFVVVMLIIPSLWINILNNPYECILMFTISLLFYFFINDKKILFVSCVLFVIFFNGLAFSNKSSFLHKLSINEAVMDVENRFGSEDSLIDPVKTPILFRRISYNKYFLIVKKEISEIVNFFDFESLFYQEVHPSEQKSLVIFFWPEIFLFGSGLYFLTRKKNLQLAYIVFLISLVSLISFLFSPNVIYRKFFITIIPVSIIISLSIYSIFKTKILFGKICGYLLIFLTVYGFVSYLPNLSKRTAYWLDNRPMYFEFVYKNIKKEDYLNFDKIYINSMVGNSKLYCRYYLDYCKSDKFEFKELNINKLTSNSIYAGFIGEFVGSDIKNNVNNNWKNIIESKGITIINSYTTFDTIAYKYGNIVIIGKTNK